MQHQDVEYLGSSATLFQRYCVVVSIVTIIITLLVNNKQLRNIFKIQKVLHFKLLC